MILRSAGWTGWRSVADFVRPSLRVRPRPKSMDFHDAENRQRPCQVIIWHVLKIPGVPVWLKYSPSELMFLPLGRKLGIKITLRENAVANAFWVSVRNNISKRWNTIENDVSKNQSSADSAIRLPNTSFASVLVFHPPVLNVDEPYIDLQNNGTLTIICVATRGLLATDHVILNHGQVTWTTPELAPPLLTTTPHQREDVSALDRFNVHRCPTRRVFSGTGIEPVTKQAMVRYLYHSATAAGRFGRST
ncbi:uncharacterized protein TNCV_4759111 [Trichonephila clavipes]|nr:uncharacterized protein TNCV_4759111 [Trichonephila clavipes]